MARVSLRTAEMSTFLPVRTLSDASGLCKCIIKVPFYEAPFYYKTPILWYHKIDFLISQIRFFYITKQIFWYYKITLIFFCIKKSNLWYHKIEFVISQNLRDFVISKNLFCDITNSTFWCHKIDFLISQNNPDVLISEIRFCDIKKSRWFFLYQKITLVRHSTQAPKTPYRYRNLNV